MSGSLSTSSSRVPIPSSFRKTIQNLKEIAKNHSDDEIYAMLKECSMDPNETAQRLLLQDPFHEVKRKRDKKKENNKEPSENRWRPASQVRVGRGGRGNYSFRSSHDAGGEKNIGKEDGPRHPTDRIPSSSSTLSQKTNIKSSSVSGLSNGPPKDSSLVGIISGKESLAVTITDKAGKSSASGAKSSASMQHVTDTSDQLLSDPKAVSSSGLYASVSDLVLYPLVDARVSSSVGTIKREGGSQLTIVEATVNKGVSRDVSGADLSSLVGRVSSETNHMHSHEKIQGKSSGLDGNQYSDTSQSTHSLSRTSSVGSRPSSNYGNRSQQLNGPQKVGLTKEWKPKSTNSKPASGKPKSSDAESTTQDVSSHALPTSSSMSVDEPASKIQIKLEELQISDAKHVIIPNHLQVPESERTGLSFGSIDASFGLATSLMNDSKPVKGSPKESDAFPEVLENAEEPTSSMQIAMPLAQEAELADMPHTPANMPENLASTSDHHQSSTESPESITSKEPGSSLNSAEAPEYDETKTEASPVLDSSQYSAVHTPQTYSNVGLVPQMLGSQYATVEGAEAQARDASRIPSFLVQQSFDPATSYYPSIYRPTTVDSDGRFSPFFAPATKYNGNVAVLPALPGQTGQTPQESGNTLVLSSGVQAPPVTSGIMQTSLAVSQPSVPVFRQPSGIHISHYPPNYVPYSQYFSPFYIPPPSMHPFLSNAAFPQQPPAGNIYPAPGTAGSAPVKFSISQYKSATNAGNLSHIGVPMGYGTYNPGAVTSGSSTGSEDLASSLFKETNVYIAGQQGEGSVWIPTPGRDISPIQATPFYNLPTQGQQMAFPGIYHHPAQAVAAGTIHPMLQQSQAASGAVEMGGPPPGVYQQSQRSQMNWVNNS